MIKVKGGILVNEEKILAIYNDHGLWRVMFEGNPTALTLTQEQYEDLFTQVKKILI